MLQASHLECWRGDRRLFSDLNFTLAPGELLHVQGANGSGKTSLLRLLCGLARPAAGQVLWEGHETRKIRAEYYKDLTYLGHHNAVKDDLSALENLLAAATLAGVTCTLAQARAALQRLALPEVCEDLPLKVLSQGQKRRVALARLALSRARLWILDEPYTALDVNAVAVMQDLLGQHLTHGGMIVLTTHQEVEIGLGTMRRIQL